jgi:hypothetical protein
MVNSLLCPTFRRPCKISVDTPAILPEIAIDHLSRPGVGPEAVNVNLHAHSSPSSKQLGDEPAVRDDGETCKVTAGAAVGVGATGWAVGFGAEEGTDSEVLGCGVVGACGVLDGCVEAAGVGEVV